MKPEIQQVTFAGLNASEFDMEKKIKFALQRWQGCLCVCPRPISELELKGASWNQPTNPVFPFFLTKISKNKHALVTTQLQISMDSPDSGYII